MLKSQVSICARVWNEQIPHPWGGAFWQMMLKSPPCPRRGGGGVGHFTDIPALFYQSKFSISTVGRSTGCIAVTTPWCITKQLSVFINYFQISGLTYIV